MLEHQECCQDATEHQIQALIVPWLVTGRGGCWPGCRFMHAPRDGVVGHSCRVHTDVLCCVCALAFSRTRGAALLSCTHPLRPVVVRVLARGGASERMTPSFWMHAGSTLDVRHHGSTSHLPCMLTVLPSAGLWPPFGRVSLSVAWLCVTSWLAISHLGSHRGAVWWLWWTRPMHLVGSSCSCRRCTRLIQEAQLAHKWVPPLGGREERREGGRICICIWVPILRLIGCLGGEHDGVPGSCRDRPAMPHEMHTPNPRLASPNVPLRASPALGSDGPCHTQRTP